VAVVAVALALGAAVLLLLLQRTLVTSVADQAQARAVDVASQVREEGDGGLARELIANIRPTQLIQVVDQRDRVIASSSPRTHEAPLSADRPPSGQTVSNQVGRMPLLDDDHPYLIVARGTDFHGVRFTVVVASSLETQRETVATVTTDLLIDIPVLLARA